MDSIRTNYNEQFKQDAGKFAGFVLMPEARFDKAKFFSDLKNDWGIDAAEQDDNGEDGMVYIDINGTRVVVALMPAAVPNGEAEYFAETNYMWHRAVEEVSKHKAHIIMAILSGNADVLEKGRLYVKVACSLLKQEGAIALYSEGAVYQPKMFLDCARCLKDGQLPMLNWIWYGLYNDGRQAGFYTYGMRRFGYNEMEIYVGTRRAKLDEIRELIVNISSYVLDSGNDLKDGETIVYSADMKLPVTISRGIAVNGDTIKIHLE